MKPNLHPALQAKARELASQINSSNPLHSVQVVIDQRGPGDVSVSTLDDRVAHTAPIRQALVDEHLHDHDFVAWVDADIIEYDPGIFSQLLGRDGKNVIAPSVLMDWPSPRFYDLAGFVENGHWCDMWPPFFDQQGPEIELDGVGCFYMVPADVYRHGAKHENVPGFTDHLAVCRRARELGYKVKAYLDLVVKHADLANYGEAHH